MAGYFAVDTGLSVTTWGRVDGIQLWKASNKDREGFFSAPRDEDAARLFAVADAVLGLPLGPNGEDCLLKNDNSDEAE